MMKKVCKLILSRKFAYCLSVVVLSLVTFSCAENDQPNVPEVFSGEEQEIVFSLNVPAVSDATPQLRSIGPTEENTIKTIDLIAFRKDNTGSYFNYSYTGALAADNTPGQPSQKCKVKVRLDKYEQELVIITNAGTQISSLLNSQSWQNTTKETFLAKLEYALSGTGTTWKAFGASEYDALPMWGETVTTITQNTTQLSVTLLRMLAKIDVQLDDTKPALKNTFTLKSVRLYNTYTKGRIVPSSSVVQTSGNNVSVTAPTIPAGIEKYLGPLVYDKSQDFASGILDVAMKGAIYTFETNAPNADNLYGALEATCIVVGGKYKDEAESYYRVDFQKDGKFQNILRNHRYLVNIVDVTGSGYKTPDEAFHNRGINMDVKILDWNQDDIYNVTFDGQWYLAVSRDSIIISREDQENSDLTVITDYNPIPAGSIKTGWHVESILDNETKASAESWVKVSPKEGAPEELKKVKISTTYNNTGKPRSATIMFVAGRLHYPVTVYQSLLEKASISITYANGTNAGTEVSEIVFYITKGVTNPPIELNVNWTPKLEDFVAYKTTVSGIPYSTFDLSPDIAGITSGGNGGKPLTVAIAPPKGIGNEVFDQRAMKLVFSISNGLNTVEKSVVLRLVYVGT